MKRIITEKLLMWKDSQTRKPLILRGARQVGKSYSVVDFGKTYFSGKTHIVNLEQNPDWHSIFDSNYNVNRIKSELEILLNTHISVKTDLLFLDEIQECPKAIVSLRYFYEQMPELHIITAGSLLEFALSDISFPVGRVQLLSMHPMNFYEYLLAVNKNMAAEVITQSATVLSESVHNLLINELRNYFFVGGMPQCVQTYVKTEGWLFSLGCSNIIIERSYMNINSFVATTISNNFNNRVVALLINIVDFVACASRGDF